jgi:hypothetical protein
MGNNSDNLDTEFSLFKPNTEEWKLIPGHENYMVSSQGRVRRCTKSKGGQTENPNGLMKPRVTRKGYVKIHIDGKNRRIAHLVLLTFKEPRPEGTVCCHLNDIGIDNRVFNLRWDTMKGNLDDLPFTQGTPRVGTGRPEVGEVARMPKHQRELDYLNELAANRGKKYKELYNNTPTKYDDPKDYRNAAE